MIDLSYITEEEQEMILAVLNRDSELKKAEEQRIKKLQKTEQDKAKLKCLTGEWFYESKSHRHRDRIHGSDIIRASMKHSKPVTILEFSEIWPDKSNFLNKENKDVYIPPELFGIIDASPLQYKRSEDHYQLAEAQQGTCTPSPQPQIKPRQNPFNSKPLGVEAPKTKDGHLTCGTGVTHLPPAKVQQTLRNHEQLPAAGPEVTPEKTNQEPSGSTQTPAEDHHEDYAEPCSSQVSEPPLSLLQQGKAIHFSPEGQAPTLAEEEGSSIAKVLEWFGRVSKDSSKATESPVSPEDEIRAVPEGLDVLNAENETFTQEQMKPKPSPTSRRGLLALFSRKDIKTEVPENVLTNEELMYQPEAEEKINPIISVGQAPYTPKNSEAGEFSDVQNSSKMNIVTEGHETSIHYSTTDNVDTVDVKQMESVDQSERSPSRLANLKSFWEQENKGPKILSIKNIADTNQSEMPKLSEHENISQSRTNTPFESSAGLEDTSCMHRGLPEPHMITKHGADGSDIPSDEEKSPIFNINQKLPEPQEHGFQIENKSEESQSSSVKQEEKKDEIPPPVPTIREALTQQDPELVTVSDLKSFWEKEKSGSTILTSTLESIPDTSDTASPRIPSKDINESSLNVSSPSPGPMESPERGKSLNREAEMITLSLKEKIERTHGKQNSSKLHVESSVDDTNGMSYSTGPTSPIKSLKVFSDKGKKISPRSSPIRNSPESPDHHYKSADENLIKVPNKSRTHSPKHQPKVPPRDSYPVKESKKGSPLRAFTIDINPHQKMVTECQEDTSLIRDKTGQSHTDESCLISDENDLRITSQESPASLQRLPSSGEICIRNIDGKQISPVHSKSQVQTSAPLFISPEQHKNTSDEGTDEKTTMIEEHKRLEDLQPNINLARSYISLSYQHYLGLSESTHKSGCTDQTNWQEWIRIEVGESSGQVSKGRASTESSPSRCSQLGSEEITFDSSRSASPEAWSQSRTSSVCGSTEPSPVRTVQKQANIRPISISKSLENLATLPLQGERRKNEPKIDITLSVEDVSEASHATSSTISDPEQMKMLSLSVPAFIQHQRKVRETDCTSVNSFCSERQRKYSTDTNISACSGHDSMASVSGSVMSIYSTDFGNVEVRGTIQFAINYVQKLGEFHIFIVQCRDLAVADPKRNRSDPYVKCYLLPDKSKLGKKKTSVKKKTLNPCYNEILRYKIALEDLKSHTLNLSVWHNDTFGRNSFLGEVDVDLSEWDFSDSHMMDYALKGRVSVHLSPKRINHCMEMSGEIRVALRLLTQTSQSKKTPQTGEVQIWVKECKDLPARRGTMDPFVKCTVLPDTNRKGRQKTRVVKKTANPVFNHIMVYDGFRAEDLKEACAELTVWDHDRLSNHFIGGTRLGLGTGKSYGAEVDWMDSSSAEVELWRRMIESQDEWVEDVVPLRMLVMARTMTKQ
ncbi:synaptotagmin-like protein 2 isoform X2 [Hoplias malabaricus]|uniref:synaptotagmin-like protein 2 isoform X2 n=1 Tax=Hoplias malabaricus TaxID=27720 RepID=UPI0034627833